MNLKNQKIEEELKINLLAYLKNKNYVDNKAYEYILNKIVRK